MAIVTLRQDGAAAGADSGSLVAVGQSLVAVHDWTFLVGPSIFLGIYSLLLAYLMYRSQLVPRAIAWLGLDGGPAGHPVRGHRAARRLRAVDPRGLCDPVFAWEVSLGVYLIVKGFQQRSPINPEAPRVGVPRSTSTPRSADQYPGAERHDRVDRPATRPRSWLDERPDVELRRRLGADRPRSHITIVKRCEPP